MPDGKNNTYENASRTGPTNVLAILCDYGEKVRIAFALDCCSREALSYVTTTSGISAADLRDLMTLSIEHRFSQINQLTGPIEWVTGTARPEHQSLNQLP